MSNLVWDNLFRGSRKEKTLRQKLKSNYLFQDLSHNQLSLLERLVNVRSYRPGEVIFRQGDVGVGMYLISSGVVNIYVEDIESKTGEPKSTHVTQLEPGDFFGDLSLVEENGRRSASAIAHKEVLLIGFFKSDLNEIANRNSSAGVKILMRLAEVLGQRLIETTAKITELKQAEK